MVETQTEEEVLLRRLGANIQTRRRALGLTQAQLAERLGVETETLSRFERGTHVPKLEKLVRLAGLLQTTLADLVAEEQKKPSDDATVISAWLAPLAQEDRTFVMTQLKQSCDYLGSIRGNRAGNAGNEKATGTETGGSPAVQPVVGQESARRGAPKIIPAVALVFELADLPEKLNELFEKLDSGKLVGLREAGKIVSRINAKKVYELYERKPELRDAVLARYPNAEQWKKTDHEKEMPKQKVVPPKSAKAILKVRPKEDVRPKPQSDPWVATIEKVDNPHADFDPDSPE